MKGENRVIRGQSALEFLMTYGWAILIMLVVLSVLFYIGVINPRNAAGNSLVFQPGFTAYDYAINSTGGLYLDLGNGQGDTIVITGIACSTESNGTANSGSVEVGNGERKLVTSSIPVNCTGADAGQFYKGYVRLVYNFKESSIPHQSLGDISFKVPETD